MVNYCEYELGYINGIWIVTENFLNVYFVILYIFSKNTWYFAQISLNSIHREFEIRKKLYADPVWTCQCTGHINLTYKEAVESEQDKYRIIEQCFPSYFEGPILKLVHHSKFFFNFYYCHYQLSLSLSIYIKLSESLSLQNVC